MLTDANTTILTAPLPKPKRKEFKYGPAPKHLVEAIRKELKKLVETKDLGSVLSQIGRYATQADDFLMTVKSPSAVMKSEHDVMLPGVVNSPGNLETYGATILRELVGLYSRHAESQEKLAQKSSESPVMLVHAIAQARTLGMTDVAAELEKRLVGKPMDGKRPVDAHLALPPGSSVEDYLNGSGSAAAAKKRKAWRKHANGAAQ